MSPHKELMDLVATTRLHVQLANSMLTILPAADDPVQDECRGRMLQYALDCDTYCAAVARVLACGPLKCPQLLDAFRTYTAYLRSGEWIRVCLFPTHPPAGASSPGAPGTAGAPADTGGPA